MQTYSIFPKNESSDFDAVPPLFIDHLQWSPPVDIRAEARLSYDSAALYVYLRAYERNIRAEHTGLLDMVCEDSCLEFFLQPVENDTRYFNFEFNRNCALYLGFGSGTRDLVRLVVDRADSLFAPQSHPLQNGWALDFRVPVSFIARFFPGYSLSSGQRLRGNCYKCGDRTAQPHYLSWSPMQCEKPDFHRPQDFGAFVLV